jgi:DNA-binding response OmpR family regulator
MFQALTAEAAAQGVEISEQRSVDLLIADSGAPLGDGSEVLSELMRRQPGKTSDRSLA